MLPPSPISVVVHGSSVTLRLGAEIDQRTVPQLRSTLAALVEASPSALCIDLTENRFLCLSGVGALIAFRAGLVRRGVNVVTPGATRTFLQLLDYAEPCWSPQSITAAGL
jgi:anti-anti-sigma regulatory factor